MKFARNHTPIIIETIAAGATYWEKIPHSQFFMLMVGIAMTAGLVLFILGKPLNKIVSAHDKLR